MRATSLLCVLSAFAAAGCGAGTAAIAGGGGGGGGGTGGDINSQPTVANVAAREAELSPAVVDLDLIDAEADRVSVRLQYRAPSLGVSTPTDLTLVGTSTGPGTCGGGAPDLTSLQTSAGGFRHSFCWDFATDLATADLVSDVQIVATIVGGQGSVTPGASSFDTGLGVRIGNDPAEIVAAMGPPIPEVTSFVPLQFTVRDSSSHTVSVRAEYALDDGDPVDWFLATPVGLGFPGTAEELCGQTMLPEDCVSFPTLATDEIGVEQQFTWNVVADLGDTEHDVLFRFVPDDGFTATDESALPQVAFRVDNNAEPIAQLLGADFALNPDQRRGIPVPIVVRDDEGDVVDMVVQWKREGADFVSLTDTGEPNGVPLDRTEIRNVLADGEQRRRYQIATELPPLVTGRFGSDPGGSSATLVGLAAPGAVIPADDVVGRVVEVLRSAQDPVQPLASVPVSFPSPRAAVSVGPGEALVLSPPSPGIFSLARVSLEDGSSKGNVGPVLPGNPTAMALEPGGVSVLVATSSVFAWTLRRVPLQPGLSPLVIDTDDAMLPPLPAGTVVAVEPLGRTGALVAVDGPLAIGSSVVRLSYPESAVTPAASVIVDTVDLGGIAVRPGTSTLLAAEVSPARLVEYDVLTGTRGAVTELSALDDLGSIAFSADGTTLFLLADADGDGGRDLVSIDVAGETAGDLRVLASVGPNARRLSTGADGLVLLADADGALGVLGGVEATRVITQWDPTLSRAELDSALPGVVGREWRIRATFSPVKGSPSGKARTFVWDARDLPSGGRVSLRAVPFDAERGVESQSGAARRVEPLHSGLVYQVGDSVASGGIEELALADFDGDGSLDVALLAGAAANKELAFYDHADLHDPGTSPTPVAPALVVPVPSAPVVLDFQAGDLDGDGRVDLFYSRNSGSTVGVLQGVAGDFATTVDLTAATSRFARAADLDLDGQLDLAVAEPLTGGSELRIRRQTTPLTFVSEPTDGADPSDVAFGDLDQDGRTDIVVGAHVPGPFLENRIEVRLQDPSGAFPVVASFARDPRPGFTVEQVRVADVDRDGLLDVVTSQRPTDISTFSAAVVVHRGDAAGALESVPSSEVLDGSISTFQSLATTDLDGDGRLEIVVGAVDSQALTSGVAVLSQDAPGSFEASSLAFVSGPLGLGVGALDANGDGARDLLFAADMGLVGVVPVPGPGTVDSARRAVLGNAASAGVGGLVAAAADIDDDGLLDVMATNVANTELAFFRQTSPGVFASQPTVVGNSVELENPSSLALADFDLDGRLDVAVGSQSPSGMFTMGRISVLLQPPGGFAGSSPDEILGDDERVLEPSTLIAADLDGDGDHDLVARQPGGALLSNGDLASDVHVYLRAVTAFPTLPTQELELPGMAGFTGEDLPILAVDVDNDGDLDLVAGDEGANIMLNSGGVFGDTSSDPAVPNQVVGSAFLLGGREIAMTDVDLDGRLDVIVNGAAPELHLQTSLLVFQQAPFPAIDAPLSGDGRLVPIDWDRDGDEDLFSAGGNTGTGRLDLFRRRPDGTYRFEQLAAAELFAFASKNIAIADIDADGDLDVVSFPDQDIAIFFGGR